MDAFENRSLSLWLPSVWILPFTKALGVMCGHSSASGTNKFSYSSGVLKGSYNVIAHCLQPDAGLILGTLVDILKINRNFP